MKTTYIFLLDEEIQKSIKEEVKTSLMKLSLNEESLNSELENALSGRLCDIEQLIKIEKYL